MALWLAPLLVGAAGLAAAVLFLKRRRDGASPSPLSAEELAALAKLDQ